MTEITSPVQMQEFLRENAGRLHNRAWLSSVLKPHCRLPRYRWRGTRVRIVQHPDEFASWLVLLAERRVRSYLELGVSTGGSMLFTDAYLRAAVPGYQRTVGYDRKDRVRDLAEYRARNPSLELRVKSTRRMRLGDERFDACLVDATHTLDAVLLDWKKVREVCRLVGFHDIVLQGSGVPQAWASIRQKFRRTWEFVDQAGPPGARCGIGAVEVQPPLESAV